MTGKLLGVAMSNLYTSAVPKALPSLQSVTRVNYAVDSDKLVEPILLWAMDYLL